MHNWTCFIWLNARNHMNNNIRLSAYLRLRTLKETPNIFMILMHESRLPSPTISRKWKWTWIYIKSCNYCAEGYCKVQEAIRSVEVHWQLGYDGQASNGWCPDGCRCTLAVSCAGTCYVLGKCVKGYILLIIEIPWQPWLEGPIP